MITVQYNVSHVKNDTFARAFNN